MRYLSFLIFTVAFIAVVACARSTQSNDNTVASLRIRRNAAPTATPPVTAAPSQTPTPADDAPRITLEEAKKAYDEGKAFIIDARAEEAYKAEHIKGAVNIRQDNLDARAKRDTEGQDDHRLLFLTARTHECQFGISNDRKRNQKRFGPDGRYRSLERCQIPNGIGRQKTRRQKALASKQPSSKVSSTLFEY